MSLEAGEGEKCYRFLGGGVHCWYRPIAATVRWNACPGAQALGVSGDGGAGAKTDQPAAPTPGSARTADQDRFSFASMATATAFAD